MAIESSRLSKLERVRATAAEWRLALGSDPKTLAMIEVALLMAAADARLDPNEARHIAETISYLTSTAVEPAGMAALMNDFTETLRVEGWQARIEAVARDLPDRESRRYAYRLAAATALIDGWIHRDESRLFSLLAHAFGISHAESIALLDEARACVGEVDETTGEHPAATKGPR